MSASVKPRRPTAHAAHYPTKDAPRDRIEWLIDNSEAYEAVISAIRNARASIRISQLAFDADCLAHRVPVYGETDDYTAREGERLLDAVLESSSANGVTVEIVLNSTLLLDTADPLRRSISRSLRDTSRVEVRGISCFPQLLHAKMVIIDDRKAFLMGSPFVNGYWDDARHAPVDGCRPRRELGGRPLHDVSIGVEGPIVGELNDVFTKLWSAAVRDASDCESVARRKVDSTVCEKAVRIVTTVPARLLGRRDAGSVETLAALLDGIERARDLIYIEHQYLSSRAVAAALCQALERHPTLEVVMVLNQNPDVTAYRGWQNARLGESGMLEHPRVGLFTLWSAAPGADEGPTVNQVFVHSKVVIIDDRWAMVGSANLDGVSLDSYGSDFSRSLAKRMFRDVRNVDVGLVIRDDLPAEPHSGTAKDLRRRLWDEHLGHNSRVDADRGISRHIDLWRDSARKSVDLLNGSGSMQIKSGTFVLPYSTKSTPTRQLKDVGVTASMDLRYRPGWLEVHCSPAWV
ncbi:MAG: hypothetical protein QOH22_448, partial [Gemmatimonadaceae bacterium]|nr:hypothetical protein [Gemmatimonadaceae bacterium]